ncbi:MAG: tripartite tricarboxylate transporter substrate-binding protein, partial [Alcaligenaceae bacterium]
VPPMAQACDLPGFESSTWYGLLGPAKLPTAIVAKMSAAVTQVITTAEFQKWLTETQGITPAQDPSPASFEKIHQADIKKWAEIVRISGAQVD